MPISKQRRRQRRPPRRRNKTALARARETQTAQKQAEEKKQISPEAYMRRRVLGWPLVVLGVAVAVQHLIHHMGFWTLISPGWDDIVAGYPLAGVLGVAGAIILSK